MKSFLILLAFMIVVPCTVLGQQFYPETVAQNSYRAELDSMRSAVQSATRENDKLLQSTPKRQTTGYMSRTGFDILPAPGSSSSASARIYTVHGHRFSPSLSIGLGLGYTPYNDPLTLVPFFIDMTYRILQENASPYLFLKAGYNFSINHDEELLIDDHTGGLLLNPGAGIEFNLSSGFGFFINAGYSIDHSAYEFESWGNQTVVTDLSFRRLSFGAGIFF